MTRRNPFTLERIKERQSWTESKAAIVGPAAYKLLGILTPQKRCCLVQLARVSSEQKDQFINTVTCLINGYRQRKRANAQESPASVAASMQQLVEAVEQLMAVANTLPIRIVKEFFDALGTAPTADGIENAKEKVRELEKKIIGHRPQSITYSLIMHAWGLQKVAGDYSKHLADNWEAMKHWLEEALIASEELPPGKNFKTAYFDELMLPKTAEGGVDLAGAPRELAPSSPPKGT
jgi:hypothetical protein